MTAFRNTICWCYLNADSAWQMCHMKMKNGVMGYGTTDLPQFSETKKVCVMFPVVDLFVFVRCLLL